MKRFAATAATLLVCLGIGVHAQTPPRPPHPAADADAIEYDNTTSGLDADNVQDAIDELEAEGGGGAGVSDGDKTDITVSAGGTVWNIDAGAVGGTEVDESSLAAVPTATALAADGANCSAGQFPLGINASGAAQSCTDVVITPDTLSATAGESTTPTFVHTYPDYDDEPGVADGSGADPNPHPGSQVAKLYGPVAKRGGGTPDYGLWTLMNMWTYNQDPTVGGVYENPNLPSSGWACEFTWHNSSTQRSGAQWHECYWQFNPQSHLITFTSGGTGSSILGDQYTFTNGANCRAMNTGISFNGGQLRVNCLDRVPPVVTNTFTCSGTCTGSPSGTVSSVLADVAWRPFFYELDISTQRTNWKQVRGLDGSGNTLYWLTGTQGTNRLYLGRQSDLDTNPASLNIPVRSCFNNDAHVSGSSVAGDICIDPSDDGGADGYFLFHPDGTAGNAYAIHPTTTQCFEQDDLDASDVDRVIPIAAYQRVKIVAFGLGNNTTAIGSVTTPATMAFEDGAGNAITLSGTLTASGSDQAMAWVTVNPATEADANLTSGERIRFDVTNTPNPATDEHTVCVAYQKWRN